jgi:hypothetical protein
MQHRPWLRFLLVWLIIGPAANADPDQVQIDMVGRYPLALRWDNVVGAPVWVAGAKPFAGHGWHRAESERHDAGMYRVRLHPGDSVTVWVPASEGLRIYRPDGRLAPDDLMVAAGNGSGLFIEVPLQPSAAGDSLLLAPDWPEERLVRVSRLPDKAGTLEIALFVSRRDALGQLAPYRETIEQTPVPERAAALASEQPQESIPTPIAGEQRTAPDQGIVAAAGSPVWLRPSDAATGQAFWPLDARPPLRVRLRGPVRLALEHRLRYPPQETRTRQAYRVYAWLDGRPWQSLDFVAAQETRRAVWVTTETRERPWQSGCAQTLGRAETGYLELPAGEHELAVAATQPLYARLRIQRDPDYLLPALNAPKLAAAEARTLRPVAHGSIWDLAVTELASPLNRISLADEDRIALRVGRDNGYREGGLTAALALRQAALGHREEPRLSPQAQDTLGLFTFYRSLLPTNKPTATPPRLAWLRNRRLLGLGERPRELVVADRFSDDLLETLASATFVELVPGAELNYWLPERQAPSLLRIAVDRPVAGTIMEFQLRYDDQPPVRLRVQVPELASELFLPGTGEAGLTALSAQHGTSGAGTLSAPFAAERPPGPLVAAAVAEIALPAMVRRIRLESASRPLAVALHYRASRPYQLSESEYLEVAKQLGTEEVYRQFEQELHRAGTLTQPLANNSTPANRFDPTRDARQELTNHWLPLLRLLREHSRQFASLLGPPPATLTPRATANDDPAAAARLEQANQWLPALEQWSQLSDSARATTRAAAIVGQARALRQLNETLLAEQMLRGAFMHDPSPLVRGQAFEQLIQGALAAEDMDNALMLASAAVTRQPETERLRQLAELLLDEGQADDALTVSLALPPAKRPLAVVAHAAYELGWWRIFARTLEQWPDVAQRRLWEGYRAQREGAYQEAARLWRDAGVTGRELADRLETGLAIRDRLADPDPMVRERAIGDWARWQTRQPGPHRWYNAHHLISDYAGAPALSAPGRDLLSQTFRALPDRPVQLSVFGPARLRIDARLTHPAQTVADAPPVESWLLLRDGARIERLPITGDRPSQGLRIVDDGSELPGRKVSLEYIVDPGWHLIEVTAPQRSLLVQASIWRPAMPLRVLPELTPTAVIAAALGLSHGQPEQRPLRLWERWPFGRSANQPTEADAETPSTPAPEKSASGLAAGLPVSVVTDCRLEPRTLYAFPTTFPAPAAQAELLGRLTAALPADLTWPTPPTGSANALRHRLTALLWEVEQAPETLAQRLPEAEQLVATQPGVSGVEPLLRRLRQRAEWEPLLNVGRSAGVRPITTSGWWPESPFLRIRKALSPPVTAEEQVLSGNEELGLLSANNQATRLRLELRATDVRYSLPRPLTAWYRLDEQSPQRVLLDAATAALPLHLDVPPGQHVLRIGIAEPVANQYLRVRVSELRGRTARPVTDDLRRMYQVATASEPLQVPLMGPAWLRIDELRGDVLDSRYQYLGPGLQTVEIRPAKGQAEGLYRLHTQRLLDKPRESTPPRIARWTLEPPPLTPARVPQAPLPSTWVLQDQYALGEQQAGTWSLGLNLLRAVPIEETNGSSIGDDYLETLASYRYYNEWRRDYYQADALYRSHRYGNPTFGLRAIWQHETEWPDTTFRLSWEGYAQRSEGWAWNSTVRGEIAQAREIGPRTRHQPSLGFFYRDLRQQADYDYQPGYVDADVLSEYKYFHRRGLVVADTLVHRPWLDTLWYAGAALTSDERGSFFEPEHASATVGWKQLLGDWQVNAAYRWTHYFAQGGHDWNRPRASDSQTLRGAIWWDGAWGGTGRLQAGLEAEYDPDNRDYGIWLSLHWFSDRGRGYRDFRPGTVDFRDLRERLLPLDFNNHMDEPPGEERVP